MLECRRLLTDPSPSIGLNAANDLAGLAAAKLEARLNEIFATGESNWIGDLNAQLSQAAADALRVPGSDGWDDDVEGEINGAAGVVQSAVMSIGNTISGTHADLSFGAAFGLGADQYEDPYEGGLRVGGNSGFVDVNTQGSFYCTAVLDWLNPTPGTGVATDKVVANVTVYGISTSFQGEVQITRTFEKTNGDKQNFSLNFNYNGENSYTINGSGTQKVGNLTLEAHLMANQSIMENYGVTANYLFGNGTFSAAYENAYGYDSYFAKLDYNNATEKLFAKVRVEKDMSDTLMASATFGKQWSANQWFGFGAGTVDFADNREDLAVATVAYSLRSDSLIFPYITTASAH